MPTQKKKATTKAAVKKAPAKKKATKKTSKKKEEPIHVTIDRKVFVQAPEESHFYVGDGRILKTLHDLADAIDTISDDVFYRHVSDEHNDFANWVSDVFDERELAAELRKIQSKTETQIRVLKHLVRKLTE